MASIARSKSRPGPTRGDHFARAALNSETPATLGCQGPFGAIIRKGRPGDVLPQVPAPIEWDELEDSCSGRMGSPIRDVPGRLARIGDPLRTVADCTRSAPIS